MKKLILFITAILISAVIYAQTSPTQSLRIANATTAFNQNISVGTEVYDVATKKIWKANAAVVSTATLTSAASSFDLVNSGGTVTHVAALTLGTTGTDLSSTVATGTTTPVITLNVPTASASNRGALSSTDWTTFNNKQAAGSFKLSNDSTAGSGFYTNFKALGKKDKSDSTATDGYVRRDRLTSSLATKQGVGSYEVTTNKVTSISSGSTDTQYPSAKLLYDQLATKQGTDSYKLTTDSTAGTGYTSRGRLATQLALKENSFSKNTAFNKNFGTSTTQVWGYDSHPTTVLGYGITDIASSIGLSGYLPLSAGSGVPLTGTLYGTGLTFSGVSEYDQSSDVVWTGSSIYMAGTYYGLRTGTDHSFNIDSYNVDNPSVHINVFKLAQNGAATFSNNVAVNGTTVSDSSSTGALVVGGRIGVGGNGYFGGTLTLGNSNNSYFFSNAGATTGYSAMNISNTGGDLQWGVAGSSGGYWGGTEPAYYSTIGTATNTALGFATNSTLRLLISNSGNATFSGSVTATGATFTTGAVDGYFWKSNATGVGSWAAVATSQVWKGTWNATTNSPTLTNGTGTAGWFYRVTTAGTTDFGAGGIAFNVGDDASYNGSIWQRIPAATITGNALTKTDDTNVTLTLGGSASTSLLNAASITVGWTGTLADARIASSGVWNGKQVAITLTTTGTSGAATFVSNTLNIPNYTLAGLGGISSVGTGVANELTYWSGTSTLGSLTTATYPSLTELSYGKGVTSAIQTQLNSKIGLTALSSSATGLTYTNTTGAFSLTSTYFIPTTATLSGTNTGDRAPFTEGFDETGGSTGAVHNLAHNPQTTTGLTVSLNGSILDPSKYTVTGSSPTALQIQIPVFQYDRIVTTYQY